MLLQPYLFFEGRCDEAAEFYRDAVGAEVTQRTRIGDVPEGAQGPQGDPDKVLHMSLRIGESTLMMSDGFCSGEPKFQGFSLSLTASDDAAARRIFDALAEGGNAHMPLQPTFFSSSFGMLVDRFGVGWMVTVAA